MSSTNEHERNQHEVTVYVTPGCVGCDLTLDLIARIESAESGSGQIQVVDTSVDQSNLPSDLFAAPSWYVDGVLFSLGNPTIEQLRNALENGPNSGG